MLTLPLALRRNTWHVTTRGLRLRALFIDITIGYVIDVAADARVIDVGAEAHVVNVAAGGNTIDFAAGV